MTDYTVILDADFLSAFLKIGRMSLIREFYQVATLYVPPAVYRELAVTDLLSQLAALEWVRVRTPSSKQGTLEGLVEYQRLGAGEQEAIALARECAPSILLVNDNQARRVAARVGVDVVNIPAFLLACKQSGMVSRAELMAIIADLQTKDFYTFRQDVLDLLMS
jgi:predicted nucleic acid-binding protein